MQKSLKLSLLGATLLAAGGAFAADLPSRKGPLPMLVDPGVNWDGFYVGGHIGYATGSTRWNLTPPFGFFAPLGDRNNHGDIDSLLGGLQIGVNKQFGAFVLGLQLDGSFGAFDGYTNCGGIPGVGGFGDVCHSKSNFIGSLTARAGYAVGNALWYVKGGLGYSPDKYRVGGLFLLANPDFTVSSSDRYGWTVGGGMEYAISPNLSLFGEYDYFNFGSKNQTFVTTVASPAGPAGTVTTGGWNIGHTSHMVKFGLNYRFGADWIGGQAKSDPVPAFANDLTGEFGSRVGWTSGRFQKNLFAPGNPGQLNSRLTWPGQAGMSIEGFARVDHTSGVFAKGYVGGANIFSSHMNDEDFPPATVPYSNTVSNTKDGRDFYASADLGYTFLKGMGWNLGAFVGYHYMSERLNAFGCTQIAGNPGICVPTIPGQILTLSENEHWHSLRVGVGGSMMIIDRLKLSAEAAWLPWTRVDNSDNHWLRPNINPLTETGHGRNGFQLEAALTYAVTDRWDVGVGARYWSLRGQNVTTTFPGLVLASPLPEKAERYGVFFQTSYKFGGDPAKAVFAKY